MPDSGLLFVILLGGFKGDMVVIEAHTPTPFVDGSGSGIGVDRLDILAANTHWPSVNGAIIVHGTITDHNRFAVGSVSPFVFALIVVGA